MLIMRMRISSLQRASLLALLAVGALVGAYFAFRYTAVAQFREAVLPIDTQDAAAYGEVLFQTRGCVSCHTLERAGSVGDEGPNLTGIAERHDTDYIHESIQDPRAVIAADCPEGACQPIMPVYGDILTDDQIQALVAYLSQS